MTLIDSPGTYLSYFLQNLKKNSTGNETLDEFELTREQQKKLFEITYAREEAETKRLVKKYFNIEWKKLHPKIQQILVDLKFRGDFRPTSKAKGQKALKAAVEANDLEKFKKVYLDCVHLMQIRCKKGYLQQQTRCNLPQDFHIKEKYSSTFHLENRPASL